MKLVIQEYSSHAHGVGCRDAALLACPSRATDVLVYVAGDKGTQIVPSFVYYSSDGAYPYTPPEYALKSVSYTGFSYVSNPVAYSLWLNGTGPAINYAITAPTTDTTRGPSFISTTSRLTRSNWHIIDSVSNEAAYCLDIEQWPVGSLSAATGCVSGMLFELMHKVGWNYFDACAALRATCEQPLSCDHTWCGESGFGYGVINFEAAKALTDKQTLPLYSPTNGQAVVGQDYTLGKKVVKLSCLPFKQSRFRRVVAGVFTSPPTTTHTGTPSTPASAPHTVIFPDGASEISWIVPVLDATYYIAFYAEDAAGNYSALEPFSVIERYLVIDLVRAPTNLFVDNSISHPIQDGLSWATAFNDVSIAATSIITGDNVYVKATDQPYNLYTSDASTANSRSTATFASWHLRATGVGLDLGTKSAFFGEVLELTPSGGGFYTTSDLQKSPDLLLNKATNDVIVLNMRGDTLENLGGDVTAGPMSVVLVFDEMFENVILSSINLMDTVLEDYFPLAIQRNMFSAILPGDNVDGGVGVVQRFFTSTHPASAVIKNTKGLILPLVTSTATLYSNCVLGAFPTESGGIYARTLTVRGCVVVAPMVSLTITSYNAAYALYAHNNTFPNATAVTLCKYKHVLKNNIFNEHVTFTVKTGAGVYDMLFSNNIFGKGYTKTAGDEVYTALTTGSNPSFTGGAGFSNPYGGDFSLAPGSPAKGAGVYIADLYGQSTPWVDLNGNAVLFMPPDAGAISSQGNTKEISINYAPTGYDVREGATLHIVSDTAVVNLSGLALDENIITTSDTEVLGFIGKSSKQRLRMTYDWSVGAAFGKPLRVVFK